MGGGQPLRGFAWRALLAAIVAPALDAAPVAVNVQPQPDVLADGEASASSPLLRPPIINGVGTFHTPAPVHLDC